MTDERVPPRPAALDAAGDERNYSKRHLFIETGEGCGELTLDGGRASELLGQGGRGSGTREGEVGLALGEGVLKNV